MATQNEEKTLYDNDHICCICHLKGKHVQIHHIDSNPANDDISNLVVLCLDDHSIATGKQGFGRKYGEKEIKLYKQAWEESVKKRRSLEDNPLIPLLLADMREKSAVINDLHSNDLPMAEKKANYLMESLRIIEPLYPILVKEIEETIEKDKQRWKTPNSEGQYLTSGTVSSATASNFIYSVSGQRDKYPNDLDVPSTSLIARTGYQPQSQLYDLIPLHNLFWAKTVSMPHRIPLCPSCLSQNQYTLVTRIDTWANRTPRNDGYVIYRCPTCKNYWELTISQEMEGKTFGL